MIGIKFPPMIEDDELPPLFRAARQGDVTTLRTLLDRGESLNTVFRMSREIQAHQPFTWELMLSLLHAAVEGGHHDIVLLLLNRGADPNIVDESGATALMRAASFKNEDMVRLLIEHGGATEAIDGVGDNAILKAVQARAYSVIRTLLEAGVPPDSAGRNGYTPLMRATDGGDAETMRLLLDAGADTEAGRGNGNSILADAAGQGNIKGMNLLLEYGARADGGGALARAATEGRGKAMFLLLRRGVPVDEPGKEGLTPLLCAVLERYVSLVRSLLKRGADPNVYFTQDTPFRQVGRVTPLMVAAGYGDVSTVDSLLQHGAAVDAADTQGNTPLFYATMQCWANPRPLFPRSFLISLSPPSYPQCVRLLLEHGADPTVKNEAEQTPREALQERLVSAERWFDHGDATLVDSLL